MILERLSTHLLIQPSDIQPSDDRLEVVGTFNPGAVELDDGSVVLLVRVAEAVAEKREGMTALPRWEDGQVKIDWIADEQLTFIDPRVVRLNQAATMRLTFTSHLRVLRLADGISVDWAALDSAPHIVPDNAMETFGIEDPRITPIDGTYYITYVSVSPHGACTSLMSSRDFDTYERHGVILPPENKDVLLFPHRFHGQYLTLHRPNPSTHFHAPEMWLAWSEDLIRWGHHEPFFQETESADWRIGRIGGGCPPIEIDGNWVEIYHGNNKRPGSANEDVGEYVGAAVMMDFDDPRKVIGYTSEPIMKPETDFEFEGFVPNVVFPTAAIDRGETLLIYYGAADANVGVVAWSKQQLIEALARR